MTTLALWRAIHDEGHYLAAKAVDASLCDADVREERKRVGDILAAGGGAAPVSSLPLAAPDHASGRRLPPSSPAAQRPSPAAPDASFYGSDVYDPDDWGCRGGQGRTDESARYCAGTVGFVVGAILCIAAVLIAALNIFPPA